MFLRSHNLANNATPLFGDGEVRLLFAYSSQSRHRVLVMQVGSAGVLGEYDCMYLRPISLAGRPCS